MKKIFLFSFGLCVIAASASAQTKRIAHRSHSGSAATFRPTAGPDNFGIDTRYVRHLDSADRAMRDSLQKQREDSLLKVEQPVKPGRPATRPKKQKHD